MPTFSIACAMKSIDLFGFIMDSPMHASLFSYSRKIHLVAEIIGLMKFIFVSDG